MLSTIKKRALTFRLQDEFHRKWHFGRKLVLTKQLIGLEPLRRGGRLGSGLGRAETARQAGIRPLVPQFTRELAGVERRPHDSYCHDGAAVTVVLDARGTEAEGTVDERVVVDSLERRRPEGGHPREKRIFPERPLDAIVLAAEELEHLQHVVELVILRLVENEAHDAHDGHCD